MGVQSFLRVGSYDFARGSVMFNITKAAVLGRTGRIEFFRNRWTVRGTLPPGTPSELTTAINALETALVNGSDVVFMLDGSTESAHYLDSADTLNGTSFSPLTWLGTGPRGSGVEYWRRRSFQFTVEGDIDPADQYTDIVFWTETVERIGDGSAQNTWIESLAGSPEPQQTNAFTRRITLQHGYAIGRTDYPTPAANIWAAPYYQARRTRIGKTTPSYIGLNEQRNYMTRWGYEYHSAAALVGGPTEFAG